MRTENDADFFQPWGIPHEADKSGPGTTADSPPRKAGSPEAA